MLALIITKIIDRIIGILIKINRSIPLSSESPSIINYRKKKTNTIITHVSAFTYGNAGDTILPIALRDTWHAVKEEINWNTQHVYPVVDEEIVKRINKSKGLIIGGGGLFLRDTNKNDISGWQWPCSTNMLEKINVPIILFAIGYNRFRGQEDFDSIFYENIKALAKKAEYIGLRNNGSINAIKNYLPEELHYKLRFQPCMTTFLAKLYPQLCNYKKKEGFIAINTAFDRPYHRFGSEIGNILSSLARVAKHLSAEHSIKFYSHMPTDEAFLPFLRAFDVPFELVKLDNTHPTEILRQYAKPNLVIGMRGHAQMIPFGCCTPIVSIVSHNKMQWFLDDIQKPHWGVDVLSKNFEEELLNRATTSLNNTKEEIEYIDLKQKELYSISQENVQIGLQALKIC